MLGLVIGLPLLVAVLHGTSSNPGSPPSPAGPSASHPAPGLTPAALARETPLIARRVAALRGLRFRQIPVPKVVSTDALGQILTREYRRPRVRIQNRENQDVLDLLGLLGAGDDLQKTLEGSADIVAGAYDPASRRLYIVGDATLSSRAVAEITLAHELTHALEDQVFGLPDLERVSGDRALAEQAFVEGSATALMTDYASAHISVGDLLGAVSDPAITGDKSFAALPRVLREQLLFAYLKGQRLINGLREAGRGSWNVVDVGYRSHLPRSTEQVLHPLAYLHDEGPLAVALPPVSPGPGWQEGDSGTLGELQTSEMLEVGNSDAMAAKAAAGWGGDRYQVWRKGRQTAIFLRWRWDTNEDAAEFEKALLAYRDARDVPLGLNRNRTVEDLAIAPTRREVAHLLQETHKR